MDLILAMDLRRGKVVHGKQGDRTEYRPLNWGYTQSADPILFISALHPKYLYIADLDRIEGTGSHDTVIQKCATFVQSCYIDRGIRTPNEYLTGNHIINVIGTETCGEDLSRYHSGYLSIDIKHGKVIPSGRKPIDLLVEAERLGFEGCIILNLSAVGTQSGIDPMILKSLRSAYSGKLLYGGGVATIDDLHYIANTGFDGAIVATAVHNGIIPLTWIQEGCLC